MSLILGVLLCLLVAAVWHYRRRTPPPVADSKVRESTLPGPPAEGGPLVMDDEDEEVTEFTLAVTGNRPLLRVLSGPGLPGNRFLSATGLTAIGRTNDNDIVLAETAVSSKHCRIEQQGNRFVLLDLGSTNGTWVNGVAQERAVLRNGDQIKVGDTTMVFALFGERD